MIRVVVADDHHLVRKGIVELLKKTDDIRVIGEAEDGIEAVELTSRLRPDVLVIDISMPRMNGLQAIEKIQSLRLSTKIVILSMYSDETLVRMALRQGVHGYLLKRSVTEDLHMAVRTAHSGELYLCPALSGIVKTDPSSLKEKSEKTIYQRLSAREREVLQLISEGHTNSSIASVLGISVKTVEKHRSNLMLKLEVNDIAGLIRKAIRLRLVLIDD